MQYVDKLNSGKTITIKINGEKKSFHEEKIKLDPASNCYENKKEHTPDIPLHGSKQDGDVETAASKDSADESFEWILPEPESIQYDHSKSKQSNSSPIKKKTTSSTAKINNGVLKSVLFTVIFAVLIGTSFGVVMLKLVIADQSKQEGGEIAAKRTKGQTASETGGTVSATFEGFTAYVVQEGVYTSKEGAMSVSNQATERGVPAASMEISGKHYLFLGVANALEDVKSLGDYYQNNGFNQVYYKALTIPEKKNLKLNTSEKSLLVSAITQFHTLSKATSNALAAAPIPKEIVNTMIKQEIALSEIDSNQIQNGKVKDLLSEITAANKMVKDFQKTNNEKSLVKAQQSLLLFLSIYYSL